MEGIYFLISLVFYGIIVGIPVATILSRIGLSKWGVLFAFIPIIGIVGLWVLAFMKWPIEERAEEKNNEWSEADKEAFRRLQKEQRFSSTVR